MGEVIRTYYESGELKSEVFAINDKKNGKYKSYWKNEHQRVRRRWHQRVHLVLPAVRRRWQLYTNYTYIDSKMNGECKKYYQNGHQRVHLVLPAVRRRWHQRVHFVLPAVRRRWQLEYICFYINDDLNGEYKLYDEDGQLIECCNYVDGIKQ